MDHNLPFQHIIFYDGECGLCNGGVQFILKYEKTNEIHFSTLQNNLGQSVLKYLNLSTTNLSTFIYFRKNKYLTKSSAALYSLKDCKSWVSILFLFIIIPKFLRDIVYDLVAKNRQKIFLVKHCVLPSKEKKKRFI